MKTGQFLLQIDPRAVRSRLQISEASLEGQRIALQQARLSLDNAKINQKLADDELARQLRLDKDNLATKQALELPRKR